MAAADARQARAVTVVDQQQPAALNAFTVGFWAQTFTPTRDNLVAVDLSFRRAGSFNVQIKDLTSGYGGPVIGQTGMLDWPVGVHHVEFPAPIALVPGGLYDINIVDGTPNTLDEVMGVLFGNPYARGAAHSPGLNDNSNHDLYFVTYAQVPEPGAGVLMLSTLAASGLARRRGSLKQVRDD